VKKSSNHLEAFPSAQAMSDYMKGLGFADNPYPKHSFRYTQYEKAMHAYYSQELKDTCAQLRRGEPLCQ